MTEAFLLQKKGPEVGKTKRGKDTKIMTIADDLGLPISVSIKSAQPHKIKLVESSIKATFTDEVSDRVIGESWCL